jgi:beta-lactamase class C
MRQTAEHDRTRRFLVAATLGLALGTGLLPARADDGTERIARVVRDAAATVMKENNVPGMAIGVTVHGQHRVFTFGHADREAKRPVDDATLFEIGSISKTFTATLGGYAEARGALDLSQRAASHMPELEGTAIGSASLLDLATYTAGGLPLQFPEGVDDTEAAIRYFREWRADFAPGTRRVYSNPSIGLFGHLAARSLGEPYADLVEGTLLPALGLERTYLRVPDSRMKDYAFGYNRAGQPVRVTRGALDAQAYGIKTTAGDLLRFVDANIDPSALDEPLRRAIAATHVGHYRVGPMTQSLGWEIYAWPTTLETLLEGNSSDMARKPQAAEKLDPSIEPAGDVLINKTGSTNGFGAYAAFLPAQRIGVVILANSSYPIPKRIQAAYTILKALAEAAEAVPAAQGD